MAIAELKQRRMAEYGVLSETLSAAQIARLEPMLRPGLAGGLQVPGDGIVYAPNVARWLQVDAGSAIRVIADEVVMLEEQAVVLASGKRLTACSGACLRPAGR